MQTKQQKQQVKRLQSENQKFKKERKEAKKNKGKTAKLKKRKGWFFRRNVPTTAQETISYKEMLKDGICQVDENFFSKTVQFQDINYQLAQNEDKTQIFENYCDFLNYFDSSIHFQLTF